MDWNEIAVTKYIKTQDIVYICVCDPTITQAVFKPCIPTRQLLLAVTQTDFILLTYS
jgi:hypothetical protein